MNQGPGGAAGTIAIAQLGDITIGTLTGPGGVTIEAVLGPISISTPMDAEFGGIKTTTVGTSTTATTAIEAAGMVTVGGSDEPALLAKTFLDLFKDHTHPTPNGPSGPLSPQFAPKLLKTMSKKVFLGK